MPARMRAPLFCRVLRSCLLVAASGLAALCLSLDAVDKAIQSSHAAMGDAPQSTRATGEHLHSVPFVQSGSALTDTGLQDILPLTMPCRGSSVADTIHQPVRTAQMP